MSQPWQPHTPGQQPPQQGQPPVQAAPAPQPGQPYPQQPYPQQSYPQQPYQQQGQPYPQQPQGPMPYSVPPMPGFQQGPMLRGPLTLPNWSAALAGLGGILVAVGLFALPWLSGMGETMTLPELSEYAGDEAFTMPEMYVKWLAYVMLALQLLYSLAWTLGAIRTQTIAKLMVTWPNSELTHASFTRYRLLFGFSLSCSFLVHGLGVLTVYEGHFDLAGAGPWVVLAGTVLTVIASFIGPRKGPGLPPS
ncbi:hypothetical protein [Saccharomonospora glauca]|nr:hypothetical protein [Saccharomonospora glauca]